MTTKQQSSPSGPLGGGKFTVPIDVPAQVLIDLATEIDITVPGAQVTDVVRDATLLPNTGSPLVFITSAYVSAPNTVSLVVLNQTGAPTAGDPGATIQGELGVYSS